MVALLVFYGRIISTQYGAVLVRVVYISLSSVWFMFLLGIMYLIIVSLMSQVGIHIYSIGFALKGDCGRLTDLKITIITFVLPSNIKLYHFFGKISLNVLGFLPPHSCRKKTVIFRKTTITNKKHIQVCLFLVLFKGEIAYFHQAQQNSKWVTILVRLYFYVL